MERRLKAVHYRHAYIHQYRIGFFLFRQLDCLQTILRLGCVDAGDQAFPQLLAKAQRLV